MFTEKAIITKLSTLIGDEVDYLPYNIREQKIFYGAPPIEIKNGLQYVFARLKEPRSKLIMGLNAKGVFVNNLNTSGVVEIALMNGVASCGVIQSINATGIPLPITGVDLQSGGTSGFLATACRLVATPEWRRGKFPGLSIFTFETERLIISGGIRLATQS